MLKNKRRKKFKRFLWFILILFLLLNALAYVHAYKLTHFTTDSVVKTQKEMSLIQKLTVAFTGINNPRPFTKQKPAHAYQTIYIKSNKLLECWLMKSDSAIGNIILFHGYGGEKSSMLDKADEFLKMHYNTLLVDFMGAGGSEGNETTIGFKEAEEVKDCYQYLIGNGYTNIHLFGTSMGAVAIMKAINDYKIKPATIVIECPFGTMYKTVRARFKMMNIPSFPMAALLVFWGGVQNGFWAFSFNPEEYARKINCPTLLLYGEKDPKVSRKEIDAIYQNLNGQKKLVTYPLAGHENYLLKYRDQWIKDVSNFLQQFQTSNIKPQIP